MMPSERPPYPLYPVTIKSSHLVTPHMQRLTIAGTCLSGLRPDLPAQWFKVFVTQPDGRLSGGRAYTVRSVDWATGDVTLDLFLHGDSGPVSAWAHGAQAGDRLQISAVHPRSGYAIAAETQHYLLFGDETALPAIGAILQALPAHATAQVFAEVANPAEQQQLLSPASLRVTWFYRDTAAPASAAPLEAAARTAAIPATGMAIWAAGESAQISAIRKLLLKERGVDKHNLHAVGYWKNGEADHRDETL